MLNKKYSLLIFIFIVIKFNCQNLVKNGSFELTDFWKCVTNIQNPINSNDPYGKLSFVTSYYQPENGVRGLLSKTISSGSCAAICSALTNTFAGYKQPHTGNNLLSGIPVYASFQLSNYLLKNKQYVFECYLSGSNRYKLNTHFSFYNGAPILNNGIINFNDSTTGWLVVDLLKNATSLFQATDAFIINNIKRIDTLGWTKISACFTPNIDSVSYIAFHSNISSFMDDIAIYPAQNFNTQLISIPCNKNVSYSVINPLPNYQYTYSFGDSSIITTSFPILNHTYNNSGIYNGFLIAKDTLTNQFFCSATTSTIEFVKANFSYPSIITAEINTQITNMSLNGSTYNWSLNNSYLTNNQHPKIKFNPNKNTLCLTVLSSKGCKDSICKDFFVYDCGKITHANIFTPNEDKTNDLFYFFETESCDSSKINITIYDRWGQVHYHYPEYGLYQLNEPQTQYFIPTRFYTYKYWNGYFNNLGPDKAVNGVYFVVIETPNERKTKTITLIR